jgi:hypothetical protein
MALFPSALKSTLRIWVYPTFITGGLLPVMGGYCEAPWDQRLTEIEPSGNYIFTKERNDHNIGSDYGFGTGNLDRCPEHLGKLNC